MKLPITRAYKFMVVHLLCFFIGTSITAQVSTAKSTADLSPVKITSQVKKRSIPFRFFKPPQLPHQVEFLPHHHVPIPFFEGERFKYSVHWYAINAGFAEIKISEVKTRRGRKIYHFIAQAWTNSFFSKFFTVNDRIDTYLDSHSFRPRRYEEHIREGSYSKDRIFKFSHNKHRVMVNKKKYAISQTAQDPFSCLMLLRIIRLVPGQTFTIDVFSSRRVYQIDMKVGPLQEISTQLGTFTCFSIEPSLKLRGRVLEKESSLKMWFTADWRRIPVLMESKVKIGTIKVELIEFSPHPHDNE
ncbi:DUF3108 domain-containing protein [candidate division CSSED10-310 bacterium]|uniref:DUF3108 domain-containing protein n=1 Tax=candidate division CSSED10-310 bacterium TaxID=2855610 RepID=A0ABV6YX26_UNCC1